MNLTGTIVNVGPGNLYYRDEPPVDSSTKDGTVTVGSSVAVDGTIWLVSDASGCSVVAVPSSQGSAQGGSGSTLAWDADTGTYTTSQPVREFVGPVDPSTLDGITPVFGDRWTPTEEPA